GLNTASVNYYFKRRDDLAVACYHRALERIEEMAALAAAQATPRERVRHYLELNIELLRQVRAGEARPITVLSDIRAMDDPVRAGLSDRYRAIMRIVRGFFGPDGTAANKRLLVARTHILLENVYWLPAWIGAYPSYDFPRVLARMMEVFDHGIMPANADWAQRPLPMQPQGGDDISRAAQRKFLQAATRLINERGYRGASVERIASELNVTKGSFYHHLEAKDDLVLACFRRSFVTFTHAQRLADDAGANHGQRLMISLATLLDVQFSERGPLLRTTALQALPSEFRSGVIDSSDRMARRFAGTLADGISDGSVRAIDPMIASQMLMPMINSAYELHGWAEAMAPDEAIRLYASTMATGLFDPVG
ncbi:MAG: TetR/AcrR family transcriptional regulator, partial [Sphingopyxis sp.]